MLRTFPLVGTGCFALALLLAPAFADAADNPTRPPLTRDELRVCVKREADMHQAKAELMKRSALIEAEAARIEKLGAKLDEYRPKLDHESDVEIDAFNALIEQHKAWVEAHNAQLPDERARESAANTLIEAFNADCAKRKYYDRDMDAIKRGK